MLRLLAVALLVLANAFFVAAEFALVTVDRDRVTARAAAGSKRAKVLGLLLERLPLSLSGTQLGVTVCSLALGFVAEPTVARVLEPLLGFIPEGARDGVALALTLLVVTLATLVFGELLPKGIAVARPMDTALTLASPLRAYRAVFGPLIRLLYGAADGTVRRLGIQPRDDQGGLRSIDDLQLLIASSGREGTLDQSSAALLTRTIRFAGKTAADALVPRVDMVTVPVDGSIADLAELAMASGHSRFPVVGESADDVVGVVNVLDVLAVPGPERADRRLDTVLRPAMFVPEGRDLESLLTEMRAEATPLAVVVDEYGGVAGLVTLEDLVEEIVGEIADEHDRAAPQTVRPAAGTTVIDGAMHLDELEELVDLALPEGPYETVAGFLLAQLGHIPVPGERVTRDGWGLEVLAMDRRRISAIRLHAPRGNW